jgi:cysteine desulfurase
MQEIRYFDSAATTIMSRTALDVYQHVASTYIGNPSSLHAEGIKAKEKLEQAREDLCALLSVPKETITFTGGASEANAIVFNSLVWRLQKPHVIISNIEHSSITEYVRLMKQLGWKVTTINAPGGFIKREDLRKALTKQTRLVSLMLVNNVVGTIQDIQALVEEVRTYEKEQGGRKIHFHTDATQALGKIPFSLESLGVDSAAFSAHKFHGPKGVGFLYNIDPAIESLSRGGGQENGLRPGTENLPGIVSMVEAAKEAVGKIAEHEKQVKQINTLLRQRLSFLQTISPIESCSPYILNIATKNLPSEVFTRMLYDKGFCVSSGSACSNNAKQKGEGVLASMQVPPSLAKNSIRISFSADTTTEEAEALAEAITTLIQEHA